MKLYAFGRSSDLLPEHTPSHFSTVAWMNVSFIELTAAGQLRNYTVFPFNLRGIEIPGRTKSGANVLILCGEANIQKLNRNILRIHVPANAII